MGCHTRCLSARRCASDAHLSGQGLRRQCGSVRTGSVWAGVLDSARMLCEATSIQQRGQADHQVNPGGEGGIPGGLWASTTKCLATEGRKGRETRRIAEFFHIPSHSYETKTPLY